MGETNRSRVYGIVYVALLRDAVDNRKCHMSNQVRVGRRTPAVDSGRQGSQVRCEANGQQMSGKPGERQQGSEWTEERLLWTADVNETRCETADVGEAE
jgi:hypothetical protein